MMTMFFNFIIMKKIKNTKKIYHFDIYIIVTIATFLTFIFCEKGEGVSSIMVKHTVATKFAATVVIHIYAIKGIAEKLNYTDHQFFRIGIATYYSVRNGRDHRLGLTWQSDCCLGAWFRGEI